MSTLTKIPFGLGRPQLAGALAVFPVLGPEPRTVYRSLAHAAALGTSVTEVDGLGSVGDVLVCNPTDEALLIYEGEEIHGARQNRTFDVHALVPPDVELELPVSCVEQGRWDGRRGAERFAPAPHAPDPQLRHTKRVHANRSASQGSSPRADQGEVWNEVSTRLSAHCVSSPGSALSDVYRAKRRDLDELRRDIRHLPDQLGAVVEVSGRPVALDLASRWEVFADLLPRLAGGYALQALGAAQAEPNERAAYGFLTAALEAPRRWLPTPGMGDGFAISQRGVDGSGLVVGAELISLSAFPAAKA
jgi:ARG and Rhodanese-Phosphatase-superfamily-associated Protein domain